MTDTTALKNRIRAAIKANDNQEITGPVLQQALLDIVDELNDDSTLQQNIIAEKNRAEGAESTLQQNITAEKNRAEGAEAQLNNLITNIKNNIDNGYVYAGIATPSSTPATGRVFYLALTAGTYTDFDNIQVPQGINILKYDGSVWALETFINIDDELTAGSNNLVKGAGIARQYGTYIDNENYIYAKLDSKGKVLYAIDGKGNVIFGAGIPPQIKQLIDELKKASEQKIDELKKVSGHYINSSKYIKVITDSDNKILQYFDSKGVVTFPAGIESPTIDSLKKVSGQKIDELKKVSEQKIDELKKVSGHYINSSKYIKVITDSDNKILQYFDSKGVVTFPAGIESPTIDSLKKVSGHYINSSKYIKVITDSDNKILQYFDSKGVATFPAGIESPTIDSLKGNILNGKKYAFCGDSFTEAFFGNITDSEGRTGIDSPELYDSVRQMWKSYGWWVIDRNNMKYYADGVSGSRMTAIYDGGVIQNPNAFCNKRYMAVPKDSDYITLMFGLNETKVAIGDENSKDDSTLWGAYNKVLEYFLTEMPHAKIGIIISDAWMIGTDIATATKNIAKYWGIPYLDLGGDDRVPMRIGGKSYSVSKTAKSLRNAALQISSSNSHPNQYGHKYMSSIVENFLRTL